ncbi:MAG: hypothetical protein K1X82_14865, partial [Bacteroidia bacterium]|nr:hypothetical protein [Bacteroidia bacterium]
QIFRKTLLLFFEDKWVALLIFLLVFATNYFQMAYGNAQLTHIPGFTALGLVIYYTYLWHENPSRKKAFGIGLGLAFCTVIRPNEMVAILIPLLWNVYSKESLKNKLNLIKQNISSVGIIVLTMVGIGFIQVLYWKTGTGQWLFYSYTNAGEGFDLLNPHLLKFLFSFKKGWFIYTPIAIFLVYSLLLFKKYKPELHPGLVVFFFISFWLISSWTCWWYAGASYSARALIPAYFALFIPFGFWIKDLFQHHKWTFYLILTFCLLINIKHTIQFKRWVIHYDRTTYSYYKANFFNLTPDTTTHHLLGFDPFTSTIEGPDNIQNYTFKELGEMPLTKTSLIQGLNGQPIDSVTEFTNGFSVRVKKLPQRDHLYLKISIDVWMDSLQTVKNPLLICTMLHHKKNYKYAGKDIGDSGFKPNQWNHLELFYLIYNPRSGNDEFITYLWNRNKANFYIKNYRVDLYEPKAEDEWP